VFEYKSELLSVQVKMKGLKIVATIIDHIDLEKLDELINERAEEGWELVTHSSIADIVVGRVNTIVTFRREK